MAIVRCEESGATVPTRTVRPLPDGVTFLVQNSTDRTIQFYPGALRTPDREGAELDRYPALPDGRRFESGIFTRNHDSAVESGREEVQVWTVPPGPTGVVCSRGDRTLEGLAEFDIVDPQHLWVEPALSCDDAITYELGYFVTTTDPAAFLRRWMRGFRPDDVFGYGEYPKERFPIELVWRDGDVIGLGRLYPEALASTDFHVCRDSGITRRDG
jgi:hypothetical protein